MSCGDFPRALLMRSFVIAAVLALLPALVSSAPVFNYTKCPAHHEVQLPHFFESGYDLHKNYPGMYYELAFHDILQVAYALDRCACSCLRLLAACACGITPTTSDFEWFANHSAPENEVSIP